MASKKDPNNSLPQAAENDSTPSAKITYANEVIAIIAGLALVISAIWFSLWYHRSTKVTQQ